MPNSSGQIHKPVIETMINTTALALTATGTAECVRGSYYGFLLIFCGMALEFFKYWGRQKKFW